MWPHSCPQRGRAEARASVGSTDPWVPSAGPSPLWPLLSPRPLAVPRLCRRSASQGGPAAPPVTLQSPSLPLMRTVTQMPPRTPDSTWGTPGPTVVPGPPPPGRPVPAHPPHTPTARQSRAHTLC